MLEHGGRLQQAAQRYGIPRERWLDLSTGINPVGWQGTTASPGSWNRLPEEEDGLVEAAQAYYGAESLLAVSGSQAAIQALPRLRPRSRVGLPVLGYNEHAHRWRQAGHDVVPLATAEIQLALGGLDVLVVSNPNNPTGERFAPSQLLEWHALLSTRGGWLVVDEAFIDTTPPDSVARFAQREGLIVLRSLGKFFGLAGARVGFVVSSPVLAHTLMEWLGPWTIAGPSRLAAKAALANREWQELTRQRLGREGLRLGESLARHGLKPMGGCDLFQWVAHPNALAIHESLARKGVLTRYFAAVPSVRFGLPAREEDWHSLEGALRAQDTRDAVALGSVPNGAREVAQ